MGLVLKLQTAGLTASNAPYSHTSGQLLEKQTFVQSQINIKLVNKY